MKRKSIILAMLTMFAFSSMAFAFNGSPSSEISTIDGYSYIVGEIAGQCGSSCCSTSCTISY